MTKFWAGSPTRKKNSTPFKCLLTEFKRSRREEANIGRSLATLERRLANQAVRVTSSGRADRTTPPSSVCERCWWTASSIPLDPAEVEGVVEMVGLEKQSGPVNKSSNCGNLIQLGGRKGCGGGREHYYPTYGSTMAQLRQRHANSSPYMMPCSSLTLYRHAAGSQKRQQLLTPHYPGLNHKDYHLGHQQEIGGGDSLDVWPGPFHKRRKKLPTNHIKPLKHGTKTIETTQTRTSSPTTSRTLPGYTQQR